MSILINPTYLKRLIKELVAAEIAESWAGSQPPEDQPIYKAEVEAARAAVNEYLKPCKENRT